MSLEHRIAVARGDADADLVLRGGTVVNVLSGELERADVALAGDRIAAVAPSIQGPREVDCSGRWLAPGFIDAHMHLESTMVSLSEFARAVVPRGTTAVVLDPHEIANVFGVEGIRWILDSRDGVPLAAYVMASSCVPATHMETSGATLEAADLSPLLAEPGVLGLAEVMNFPGVVAGLPPLLDKLRAAGDRVIDGHAPGLTGRDLDAYLCAGPGSDHEATTLEEASEKLRKGMRILIREGSTARNLDALLPLVTATTERRCCFATDDRHPADLLAEGHIDHVIRRAIDGGLAPILAYRLATLNAAEWFGLDRLGHGSLRPGGRADIVVLEDLEGVEVSATYVAGSAAAREGRPRWEAHPPPPAPTGAFRLPDGWWERLPLPWRDAPARVIEVVPGQIVTGAGTTRPLRAEDGTIAMDEASDVRKLAVIERHGRSGRMGVGLVAGLGLPRGAIASSVAHDSHNVIVAGADDASMRTAVEAVAEARGGIAVALDGEVLALLALPIAGLMSERSLEAVAAELQTALHAYRAVGGTHSEPFMALSFLALPVIPALKLTDHGIVDVTRFEVVPLWEND
ncbi:MAG TPA: adenine deaminase [Longimicrobiales bacterium]|nr:adenine deaminase [Longimicrobiales bacterium]